VHRELLRIEISNNTDANSTVARIYPFAMSMMVRLIGHKGQDARRETFYAAFDGDLGRDPITPEHT
jgi:hypothetical protein